MEFFKNRFVWKTLRFVKKFAKNQTHSHFSLLNHFFGEYFLDFSLSTLFKHSIWSFFNWIILSICKMAKWIELYLIRRVAIRFAQRNKRRTQNSEGNWYDWARGIAVGTLNLCVSGFSFYVITQYARVKVLWSVQLINLLAEMQIKCLFDCSQLKIT